MSTSTPFVVGPGDTVTFSYVAATNAVDVTVEGAPPPDGATHAVIHYLRDDDYGDHTTGDYNDFWGLHLWGDIDEAVEWTAPKPFLGEDEYGRFAWVELAPGASNVGFIVHRGDTKDGTDADRFFDPSVTPEIWLRSDDAATYPSQAEAQGYATIYYHRDDGDYGDPTSGDYNDFWGLHVWTGAALAPDWTAPLKPAVIDGFGPVFDVPLVEGAPELAYILHRGDEKDQDADQFLAFDPWGYEVWILAGADLETEPPYLLPFLGEAPPAGDTTAPELDAELLPIKAGRRHGFHEVAYSCTDDEDPDPTVEAALNGVSVSDGDRVFLIKTSRGALVSRWTKGVLRMKAPEFELVVSCLDEAGNESVATAEPVFVTP